MSITTFRTHKKRDDEQPRAPLVPAPLCFLASLLVPGLGHVLARAYRAGITIFLSFISLILLFNWRVNLASSLGVVPETLTGKITKAISLEPLLGFIGISVIVFYIWAAVDAYLKAKKWSHPSIALFAWIIVVFFVFGWQIGEIDLVRMVRQASDAKPVLMSVIWPWEKARSYPETVNTVRTLIESPCSPTAPAVAVADPEKPSIVVSPTCGNPSEPNGEAGTKLVVEGFNFETDKPVEIFWRDPINNTFPQRVDGAPLSLTPEPDGSFKVEVVWPYRLLSPSQAGKVTRWEVQARQVVEIGKAVPSAELKLATEKIIETIFIGMMATFFGIILAMPFSFLAAKNLMSGSKLMLQVYYLTRTLMNIVRSIEPLIWAIILVQVVGLGPFAGILALTLHSMAALAKMYSEAIESIDPGPIEAVQATGANWLQTVMYAVIPQVIPPFVSFTIYRWDINIRMSTIIGFVGGGGIGFLLQQWIRLLDYKAAGIAVWFITITVAILDYVSAEIRSRFS